MTDHPQLNLAPARALLKRRPKFAKAIKMFAERGRGRGDTTFRRFKRAMEEDDKAPRWTSEEVREFFEMLQDVGAGHIEYSADTPRFIWHFHLQSVACALLGIKEPVRRNKDGEVIAASDGFRKPTPPRKKVPRLGEPAPKAPKFQSPLTPDFQFKPAAPGAAPGVKSQVVKLSRDGFDIEMDLSTMTPEACEKLTSILINLNKRSKRQ
jgi:hypothetical protein